MRLQYPKVLFTHIANERQTTPQRGAKFKKMGVKSGMPDLVIFHQNNTSIGLAIELKIKPNEPTENQLGVLDELSSVGWQTNICYDFTETQTTIDNYFNNVH